MSDAADTADGHDLGGRGGDTAEAPLARRADESVAGTAAALRPAQATAPSGPTAVQLALEAGWTMSVLYGKIERVPPGEILGLPTAGELPPAGRRELELGRLRHLLQRLAHMPDHTGSGLPTQVPASAASEADLKDALTALNQEILCALAVARQATQLAYDLGRSLRDTVNPPAQHPPARQEAQHPPARQEAQHPAARQEAQHPAAPALARPFARDRVATLQGWLAALSGELPPRAAPVVAASLGRWAEFAEVMAKSPTARLRDGDSTTAAESMRTHLVRQGDLWLMLLTGTRATSGLLSPEGYVAAGELALRRSAAIIRRILRHYWVALAVGAAALGAVLYLAVSYLGGAAKVWTSIAAIAGSLGITARAVAATTARLAAEAERPVFAMAEEDVMAWAATIMPPVRLTPGRVRQLRRAGIAPTSNLGRV